MSESLTTRGFRKLSIDPNEAGELVRRTDKGYLLEVDAKYSKELHNSHNALPFMCERMKINLVEKLVPNLYNKKELHHSHSSIGSSPQTRIDSRENSSCD